MAKLFSKKYTKGEYNGQTITFPHIGTAAFGDDGTIEVPDDKVADFIKATVDSFDFQDVNIPRTEKELAIEAALEELLKQKSETILQRAVKELGMKPEEAATSTDDLLRTRLAEHIIANSDSKESEVEKKKRGPKPKVKE